MDVAFFVGDPDVTQVLFEVDLDHFRGDCPAELAGLEVHLHFVFLVAPGELADFLRHEGRLGHSGTSFVSRVRFDQHGGTPIDFAVFFEVDGAFS